MSDVLTPAEKLQEFFQTPNGMLTVGAVGVAVIVGMLFIVGVFNSGGPSSGTPFDKRQGEAEDMVDETATKSFDAAWRENMEGSITFNSNNIGEIKKEQEKLREDVNTGNKQLQNQVLEVLKEVKKKVREKTPVIVQPTPGHNAEKNKDSIDNLLEEENTAQTDPAGVEAGEWETITVGGSKKDIRKRDVSSLFNQKAKPKEISVPMGSFVRARLLTGVMAPTKGTPWPMLMVIDRPIQGPNGQTYPASGCFAIGHAKGHIGTTIDKELPNGQVAETGRVEIRVSGISCDWGTIGFDQAVVGYAVDKDRQIGIEGIVHNRLPKEILMQMEAAGLGGLGQALVDASTNTTTTTNATTTETVKERVSGLLQPVAGATLSEGAKQLQTYLTEKAKESVTTIEVPGGIELDFFVTESFKMKDQRSVAGTTKGGIYGKNGMY